MLNGPTLTPPPPPPLFFVNIFGNPLTLPSVDVIFEWPIKAFPNYDLTVG